MFPIFPSIEGTDKLCVIIFIVVYLPSVAYDPEVCQKLDRLQNYKITWNDLPLHQQSSHEVELR